MHDSHVVQRNALAVTIANNRISAGMGMFSTLIYSQTDLSINEDKSGTKNATALDLLLKNDHLSLVVHKNTCRHNRL